ncbi:MAG: hypothetical protein AB8H79_21845 [Myxococcota bacterium]
MTQLSLLLPRTEDSRPDEETGVQIAWAMDGGRAVHIARYSHLREHGARPELSCLGCTVPVVPVLPLTGGGRPHRLDHFRHKKASPSCTAHYGIGARLWNATLHLHQELSDLQPDAAERLYVLGYCDTEQSSWTESLPLFATGCTQRARLSLPRFDTVRLTPTRRSHPTVPNIRLFLGEAEVLRIRVVPAAPTFAAKPLPSSDPPELHVHISDHTYDQVLSWSPVTNHEIPCTRATPRLTYRCPDHL